MAGFEDPDCSWRFAKQANGKNAGEIRPPCFEYRSDGAFLSIGPVSFQPSFASASHPPSRPCGPAGRTSRRFDRAEPFST